LDVGYWLLDIQIIYFAADFRRLNTDFLPQRHKDTKNTKKLSFLSKFPGCVHVVLTKNLIFPSSHLLMFSCSPLLMFSSSHVLISVSATEFHRIAPKRAFILIIGCWLLAVGYSNNLFCRGLTQTGHRLLATKAQRHEEHKKAVIPE